MSKFKPLPSSDVLATLEPQMRLKQLIDYSNEFDVGPHVPPIRYYRSGQEMIRMANVYYKEGSLENAYVLYLKFMTLFLEKIRKHPEFRTVSVAIKAKNQATLREILPRAEKIKQQLLEQYTNDYKKCVAEMKQLELAKKSKEEEKTKGETLPKQTPSSISSHLNLPDQLSSINKPPGLDNIFYPDYMAQDIPSAPPPTPAVLDRPGAYTPTVDRSSKPQDVTAQGRYDTSVLRSVVIPVQVMTLFQAMAQTNTFKNIETCGILAGVLLKNELIITHLILPKQKGTSDTCMTTNEEEIFDYQDQHSLITLGWIHTHPTQTAFLSSVDLHTHCPYQLLMPEAIAIVCSPKYNETGIFILTHSGLKFIANCRQTGFHPHPTDPPLFIEADHVRIENKAPLEVLDLRSK